jgi:hypothetical protein
MNSIGLLALVSGGVIYGAYAVDFHPTAVAIAALGFLAYAVFSRPSIRRPVSRILG